MSLINWEITLQLTCSIKLLKNQNLVFKEQLIGIYITLKKEVKIKTDT